MDIHQPNTYPRIRIMHRLTMENLQNPTDCLPQNVRRFITVSTIFRPKNPGLVGSQISPENIMQDFPIWKRSVNWTKVQIDLHRDFHWFSHMFICPSVSSIITFQDRHLGNTENHEILMPQYAHQVRATIHRPLNPILSLWPILN